MDKTQLIQYLNFHIAHSQPSERWAMYRLIAPIVDFANEANRLTPYFEYNQTSSHGTNQSVDIALLKIQAPVVLIEAKKLGRKVSAEQISKYLLGNERGIVSNGGIWVLCSNKKYKSIKLFPNNQLSEHALDEIVSFIREGKLNTDNWKDEKTYYKSNIIPPKQIKDTTGKREVQQTITVRSSEEFKKQIAASNSVLELERILLESMYSKMKELGGFGHYLRCEFRSARVSFFSESTDALTKFQVPKSNRIARIEFGKKQPDVLILSTLVKAEEKISEIVTPFPHDKGPHQRRFRLKNAKEAKSFGDIMYELMFREFS